MIRSWGSEFPPTDPPGSQKMKKLIAVLVFAAVTAHFGAALLDPGSEAVEGRTDRLEAAINAAS
jgi:hypothetical protein